jgi:anti-sigma factor RsiW
MRTCEQMSREELDGWVDGQLAGERARRAAAHVATCPHCAAYTAGLRAQKDRLARWRTATNPTALPPGLWETTRAALDGVDARRRAAGQRSHRLVPRRTIAIRVAAVFATLIVAALGAAVVWRRHVGPVVPVQALLAQPLSPAGERLFHTDDPDRAASWLGQQLNAEIPPVNLSLAGARIVAARADRRTNQGLLIYRGARGVPIALHLYLIPGTRLPPLPAITYEGSSYRVAERQSPPASGAAWQTGGRTFVAVARLPLAELLPYVHEMDRSCRRRSP